MKYLEVILEFLAECGKYLVYLLIGMAVLEILSKYLNHLLSHS